MSLYKKYLIFFLSMVVMSFIFPVEAYSWFRPRPKSITPKPARETVRQTTQQKKPQEAIGDTSRYRERKRYTYVFAQNPGSTGDSGVIVPIGKIDKTLLENLSTVLYKIFNMQFIIEDPLDIPKHAFDFKRGQYDSSKVLKELHRYKGKRVLGVIDKDLCAPKLNFVFGQADLPGAYAVISITRLSQEFYGLPKNDKIFFDRVVKEAVHELGHTYGLHHCSNPECVMFFSNSLLDTDRKGSSFCESCLKELKSQ